MTQRLKSNAVEINVLTENNGTRTVFIHYIDIDEKDSPDIVIEDIERLQGDYVADSEE